MAENEEHWTICSRDDYQMPGDILTASDFFLIVPFFLYRTATKNNTTLAWDLDTSLGKEGKSKLYKEMMTNRMDSFHGVTEDITRDIDWAAKVHLTDQNQELTGEKGIFRQERKSGDDDYSACFDSILKHIRNSIAHGRMKSLNGYLLLEDFAPGRKAKAVGVPIPLTARLVIRPKTLVTWAGWIEQAYKGAIS